MKKDELKQLVNRYSQESKEEKNSKPEFGKELEKLINKHSLENKSDTPNFILAEYVKRCLEAGEYLINRRENWYDRESKSIKKT